MALVTGASSGIGRAIAVRLAQHEMKVVACARRLERLQELSETERGAIIPMQCDLRSESDLLAMFQRIRAELGGVDVCVNNAGLGHIVSLMSGSTDKWREMLDVNVLALCICTREAVKSMRERDVDDGYIFNIGSISGHFTSNTAGGLSFYSATKHAVATYSNALTGELKETKSRIRVMEISPGLVETEMVERVAGKRAADKLFSSIEALSVDDIADVVIYGLSAPPHVQIVDVIIRPVDKAAVAMTLTSSSSNL